MPAGRNLFCESLNTVDVHTGRSLLSSRIFYLLLRLFSGITAQNILYVTAFTVQYETLTHSYLETRNRVISKQCRS